MENDLKHLRVTIGISACLVGQRVRYDGDHKRFNRLLERLSHQVDWKPFCPEVEAGLGTPRPPVQLIENNKTIRALGVENKALDVTDQLQEASIDYWSQQARHRHVSGYIFKARSPSCGRGSTPVVDHEQHILHHGDGIFASHCQRNIAAVEDTWFQSDAHFVRFLAASHVARAIQRETFASITWLSEYLEGAPSEHWIAQLLDRSIDEYGTFDGEVSGDKEQKAALVKRLFEIWPVDLA
ncbi:hypothetical protein NBRC116494_01460 [Aurantivibrio plasticivorans]